LRQPDERTPAPPLERKGRGWKIAESRLDTLHQRARELRRSPSPAQALLGERLTGAELGKFKFRREVVIGSAIVDFACQPLAVVVEIDQPDGDPLIEQRRDRSLGEVGFTVLRFTEAEVLADSDAVVATIIARMKARYDERRAKPRASGQARSRHQQG
ncbi:MAG: endonuclease domain-containing protein, partial [Novosphingobium sp.]|nr:endonuclease domain-containing protein [Novosphingobium sp.]